MNNILDDDEEDEVIEHDETEIFDVVLIEQREHDEYEKYQISHEVMWCTDDDDDELDIAVDDYECDDDEIDERTEVGLDVYEQQTHDEVDDDDTITANDETDEVELLL